MNEPKTVKSSQAGMEPTQFAGASQGPWSNDVDETQYVSPDRPTPPRGQASSWPFPGPATPVDGPGVSAPTMIIGGPVAEPSFAWLVIVEGVGNNPLLGRPLSLKFGGTTTIGRVPGNDIVIADPACSSQHAKVRQETGEDGKQVFVIYDLASANGLYIGAKGDYKEDKSRVYRHILKDGDYILIGETTLVFKQV